LSILVCGLSLAATAIVWAGEPELRIEVRAREVAPGEPLRVDVESAHPLASLEGKFLGEPIFLVRRTVSTSSDVWSGWAMIGLDQKSGPTALELTGVRADGSPVVGTHAVTILDKSFPEEHLSVQSKYVEPPPEVQKRLASEREKVSDVYRSRRPVPPADVAFVRPVPGDPTSIFGTRRLFNDQPRSPHPGLDLRAASGTPVLSSGDGLVTLAQDLYYSGNTVIVDHGGGLFTIYAHLSEITVEEGEEVDAGAPLGKSGATGRVTGPHLHWGAKIGSRPFDPTALLDAALFD
jgi:murein DD-endopeptidase MepM/ murein hydrolase activator NlpD